MKQEEIIVLKLDEKKERLLDAVGNKSRLKIILALWRSEKELTVYKICRFTGLKRKSVAYNLRKLVESNLVAKKNYGEILLYTLNEDAPETEALIDFFIKARL